MAPIRDIPDDEPIEINLDPELVFYIITKAREFDVKVDPVEPDPGSDPVDDGEREILEDLPDDPTETELRQGLEGVGEDGLIDLVAMTSVGAGDFSRSEWGEARAAARDIIVDVPAISYLLRIPNLGDLLEEGFTQLGYSTEPYEANRL